MGDDDEEDYLHNARDDASDVVQNARDELTSQESLQLSRALDVLCPIESDTEMHDPTWEPNQTRPVTLRRPRHPKVVSSLPVGVPSTSSGSSGGSEPFFGAPSTSQGVTGESTECYICCSRPRTSIFFPCLHMLCCAKCAQKYYKGKVTEYQRMVDSLDESAPVPPLFVPCPTCKKHIQKTIFAKLA